MSVKYLLILPIQTIYFLFGGFVKAELIKLAKTVGVHPLSQKLLLIGYKNGKKRANASAKTRVQSRQDFVRIDKFNTKQIIDNKRACGPYT